MVGSILSSLGCADRDTSTAPELHRPLTAKAALGYEKPMVYDDRLYNYVSKQFPYFAGIFSENDRVVVSVTVDPDSLTAPDVRGLVAALVAAEVPFARGLDAGRVLLRKVDNSFAALYEARVALRSRPRPVELTVEDIDEVKNRLVFGTYSPSGVAAVQQWVSAEGVNDISLVEVWKDPRFMQTTLHSDHSTLGYVGGILIMRAGGSCSLGLNVYRTPGGVVDSVNKYFLTASHCGNVWFGADTGTLGGKWGQGSLLPTIADEYYDPLPFTGGACPVGYACRWSDAMLVKYRSGIGTSWIHGGLFVTETPPSGPRPYLKLWNGFLTGGYNPYAPYPPPVLATGATTGTTIGTFISFCADYGILGSSIKLLCQDKITNAIEGGDSGGPVFETVYWSQYSPRGIRWGGPDPTGPSVYSPIENVRIELGGFVEMTSCPAPWCWATPL